MPLEQGQGCDTGQLGHRISDAASLAGIVRFLDIHFLVITSLYYLIFLDTLTPYFLTSLFLVLYFKIHHHRRDTGRCSQAKTLLTKYVRYMTLMGFAFLILSGM